MNEPDWAYFFGNSIGYVLFGYLLIAPLWGLGIGWNRAFENRRINPWLLPTLALLGIYACFAIVVSSVRPADLEDEVVLLGLLPATVGCLMAAHRHGKRTLVAAGPDDGF